MYILINILDIANSYWMYLIGAFVTIFVIIGSLYFIIRAYKQGIEHKMDKKVLKKTIYNSAIFTFLPSISILIGVIALSGKIGVPLPWIRLSVIGALHYESIAVSTTIDLFQQMSNLPVTINAEVFVTIASVMTLGILSGPIYCLFCFKAYDKKVLKKVKTDQANNTERKPFGAYLFNAVFIAMICSFLAVDISKLKNISSTTSAIDSFTPFVVIVVTFLSMAIFDLIEKKTKAKWLQSFDLGFSMLIGMTIAVLIGMVK